MLSLKDITVKYGNYAAIRQANIEVTQGEIVVLLGANGAGKSTLFRTISGLTRPSSGKIYFESKEITGLSPDKIVQAGIVQCPEDRKLFPRMSVYENLLMGAYVIRRNQAEIKRIMEEVYELFPILYEKKDDMAGLLSGGQQQMLAIGRSLMAKPDLMLLDEPSMGLAPLIVEQMFRSIEQINKEGTTILLAEQNANAALNIAQKGYVFENGNIVVQGSRDDLYSNDEVRKAYIGA